MKMFRQMSLLALTLMVVGCARPSGLNKATVPGLGSDSLNDQEFLNSAKATAENVQSSSNQNLSSGNSVDPRLEQTAAVLQNYQGALEGMVEGFKTGDSANARTSAHQSALAEVRRLGETFKLDFPQLRRALFLIGSNVLVARYYVREWDNHQWASTPKQAQAILASGGTYEGIAFMLSASEDAIRLRGGSPVQLALCYAASMPSYYVGREGCDGPPNSQVALLGFGSSHAADADVDQVSLEPLHLMARPAKFSNWAFFSSAWTREIRSLVSNARGTDYGAKAHVLMR